MNQSRWWVDHERLWKQLVPRSGQADTIQGELIRCTGKLSDEAYRNGNKNWDANHEQMLSFVSRTLDDPSTFNLDQRTMISKAVERITQNIDSPDVTGHGSDLYLLCEMAVSWCLAHSEPISRPKNLNLKR